MSLKKFLSLEMRHASTGIVPDGAGSDLDCYRARVVRGDLRRAEAFVELSPTIDPLQELRTRLRRGSLTEADNLLSTLSAMQEDGHGAEIGLEAARLAAYRGDWARALSLSDEALRCEPSGLSQMTLRQVRAVAFLEQNQPDLALFDLRKAAALGKLFPSAGLGLYVAATEMRILIQKGSLDKCRVMLDACWRRTPPPGDFNFDFVLTLLRVEICLRHHRHEPTAGLAYSAALIAHAMGDEVYRGLAVLELYVALKIDKKCLWQDEVDSAIGAHVRLSRLFAEMTADGEVSFSAKMLRRSSPENFGQTPADLEACENLWFIDQGLHLHLPTLTVNRRALTPQLKGAMAVLAVGACTKKDLFTEAWDLGRFIPHLHDDVVRRLLHRLRKVGCGIETKEDGTLELPRTFLVNV